MGFKVHSSRNSLPCFAVLLCCISYGLCADSTVGAAYQAETQLQSGHSNIVPNTANSAKDAISGNYGVSANAPQQYRSAYYYSAHQKPQYAGGVPVLNRDSYVDAASDFGYNQPDGGHGQQGQQIPSYHPPSNAYGIQDGGDGYTDFDGAGGGIGGLAGLAGLLGIKGLKGLGLLGLLKAGLLPILFLLLPALLLIPLLIFFLPIPVITIPTPAGRSFGVSFNEIGDKMSNLARSVLDSDKCVERITCEMSRYSRGTFVDKTLKRMIFKFEQNMPSPLQRLARAYIDPVAGAGCQRYGCFLMDDASTKRHKKTQ